MPVNALIYTVAIGRKHRRLAWMLGRSLRLHGYTGNLSVISDVEIDGWENHVLTREVIEELQVADVNAAYARTMADALIPDFFDREVILYADADCMAVAPVDGILASNEIAAQVYGTLHNSGNHLFTGHDQSSKMDDRVPCSGLVRFPGGSCGRDFFRLWAFETGGRRGNDEAALRLVFHRASTVFGMKWSSLPHVDFVRCPTSANAAILHFQSCKELMEERFRQLYGEVTAEMIGADAPIDADSCHISRGTDAIVEFHRRPLLYAGDMQAEFNWLDRFESRLLGHDISMSMWLQFRLWLRHNLRSPLAYAQQIWCWDNAQNRVRGLRQITWEESASQWGWASLTGPSSMGFMIFA